MIRRFLFGVFWGTVIAALGLGTISQLSPPPVARIEADVSTAPRSKPADPTVEPEAPAPEPAAAPVPEPAPLPEAPAVEAAPEPVPVEQAAAEPQTEPTVSEPATTEPAVTAAPAEPAAAAIEDLVPPSGSEFAKPLPDLDPVAPVVEVSPKPAATKPGSLGDPASDTVTVTDQPSVAPKTGLDAPKALIAPEDGGDVTALPKIEAGTDAEIALLVPGQLPLPGSDPAPASAENPVPTAKVVPAEVLLKPLPEVLPLPETKPQAEPAEQLAPDPVLVPDTGPVPKADASNTLAPTPALTKAVDGVTIGRLPRIGDSEPVPEDDAAPASEANPDGTTTLAIEGGSDLPPLQKYAGDFENPDSKPLFAIILIDTGEEDLDRAALAELPFPVSFVLDPLAASVAEISKIYRDAGKEVIMVATGIPAGATPSDLEVTFAAHATSLPEAVAVIDTEFGAFQADRPLATQVVPILKAQGRGLITWDRGLNAADQVARRDGLAAGMVYRKLDGKGENKSAVRRALDRAAFKAAQDGRVMVIGQTLPDTVAALMEWAVEGRAASVALAPVSAVLTTQ